MLLSPKSPTLPIPIRYCVCTKQGSQLKKTFSSCVNQASDLEAAQAANDRNLEASGFINLADTLNQDAELENFAKRLGGSKKLVLLDGLRRILLTAALRTLDGT